MRRGFLNSPQAKRVIEEVYAPQSPPMPRSSSQGKPSSSRRTRDVDEKAAATGDAISMDVDVDVDVEMAMIEDVSNGTNRVVAGHTTTRATEGSEAELPSLDDGDNDTKGEPPSKDPAGKGKGKERVVDTDEDIVSADDTPFLPRPHPWRPGRGRTPDEDIFHTVPRSHGGPHVKRAVFRLWPRDPSGKVLVPSEQPRGTQSPDGYPWGATLYDFYHVSRVPTMHAMMTIMTGSALLEAMNELGELEEAVPEIEWAKSEGKPRVEGASDTGELIASVEWRLQLRAYHNFSMLHDVRRMALPIRISKEDEVERASGDKKGEHDEEHNKEEKAVVEQAPEDDSGDGGSGKDDEAPEDDADEEVNPASVVPPPPPPPPPTIPVTSPFHPSHYPKPWPFIPFEDLPSVLLQERIPLYLLPQTLYVHDPFKLLPACEREFRDTSWMSRPDFVRTYNLKLSESIRNEVKEARRKAEELEVFKSRTLIILRYKRTKEQIRNHEPMIEVPLPPYPRHLTKVEESHLYLSPVAKVGTGHHSIVYKGEWELPRDLFTRPKLCRLCFKEAVDKEVQRLKDTGRWEKLLRAAAWGPKGFTGRLPTKAELNEVSDSINLERDGEIIEREITCIVSPDASPSQIFELVDESKVWDLFMNQKNANNLQLNFTEDENEGKSMDGSRSRVATIRIDAPLSYESQKLCTHGPRRFSIPRTAKLTVVAKLSIQHDHHLVREARNYQQFPEHFFHHYNGYTIISQLHTIVPVNAVVPQFYGYYTPKQGKVNEGEPYLSPILLLEHCGNPIDPEKLSVEDQDECASLLLRFQRAGWLHESVAPRNFLVQLGKPTESPLVREAKPELSFRMIDFGRSRVFKTAEEKRAEEMEALHMFEKLNGKMNVTLSM